MKIPNISIRKICFSYHTVTSIRCDPIIECPDLFVHSAYHADIYSVCAIVRTAYFSKLPTSIILFRHPTNTATSLFALRSPFVRSRFMQACSRFCGMLKRKIENSFMSPASWKRVTHSGEQKTTSPNTLTTPKQLTV